MLENCFSSKNKWNIVDTGHFDRHFVVVFIPSAYIYAVTSMAMILTFDMTFLVPESGEFIFVLRLTYMVSIYCLFIGTYSTHDMYKSIIVLVFDM